MVGIERHSVDCTFFTLPTVPDVLYGVPAWVVKVDEMYASHDFFAGTVRYNGMKLPEVFVTARQASCCSVGVTYI
jgi:hypothetical protein